MRAVKAKNKIACLRENQEAILFKRLADYNKIAQEYLAAIPNGGFRNAREARNLKAQGVRAGVSDYLLAYPHAGKAGLWIELKRRDPSISKPTPEQEDWLNKMRAVGYAGVVAYGALEAIKAIENYLAA